MGTGNHRKTFFLDDDYNNWIECGGGDLSYCDYSLKVGCREEMLRYRRKEKKMRTVEATSLI